MSNEMTMMMPSSTTSSSVQTLLDRLSGLKREAFNVLDQALTIDYKIQDEKKSGGEMRSTSHASDEAIVLYEKALVLIKRALDFYLSNLSLLNGQSEAVKLKDQLDNMRDNTMERLNYLHELNEKAARQTSDKANTITHIDNHDFLDLADDILADDEFSVLEEERRNNIEADEPSVESNLQKRLRDGDFTQATEIFRLDNGVQLFYIAQDGTVSTPSHPTTMSIYAFNDTENKDKNQNMLGFIRVGSWVYPLMPTISPAMKTNFNAYIFPNEEEDRASSTEDTLVVKCNFVGLTFTASSKNEQSVFEDILSNYGTLIHQNPENAMDTKPQSAAAAIVRPLPVPVTVPSSVPSVVDNKDEKTDKGYTPEYIAKQLISGANYLAKGVGTTTDYANGYIKTGGDKLKGQLKPNEKPTKVSPGMQKTFENVRYGTNMTVRVSSYLLGKLGSFASYTGRTVAPYIRDTSTSLLSKTGVVSDKQAAGGYVDGFCTVAGSSLQGFALVYDSLESAAKSLANGLTEQSVIIVDHKYGPEAARVTENGLYSVGNVAVSANNVRNLKVFRTVAKATAKETIAPANKRNALADQNDSASIKTIEDKKSNKKSN